VDWSSLPQRACSCYSLSSRYKPPTSSNLNSFKWKQKHFLLFAFVFRVNQMVITLFQSPACASALLTLQTSKTNDEMIYETDYIWIALFKKMRSNFKSGIKFYYIFSFLFKVLVQNAVIPCSSLKTCKQSHNKVVSFCNEYLFFW